MAFQPTGAITGGALHKMERNTLTMHEVHIIAYTACILILIDFDTIALYYTYVHVVVAMVVFSGHPLGPPQLLYGVIVN